MDIRKTEKVVPIEPYLRRSVKVQPKKQKPVKEGFGKMFDQALKELKK